MAETGQILFSYKEVVEALLKKQGIHEGVWQLFVKFNLAAANIGQSETEVVPAAIVGIAQLGLLKADKESSIAVDAARVNPQAKRKGKGKGKT
jgi:hypothetical protein